MVNRKSPCSLWHSFSPSRSECGVQFLAGPIFFEDTFYPGATLMQSMNSLDNLKKRILQKHHSNKRVQHVMQQGCPFANYLWRSNHFERTMAAMLARFLVTRFFLWCYIKDEPTAITRARWINWKPLYPTSLLTFHSDAADSLYKYASLCLVICATCWFMLRIFCNKIYFKEVTLNKILV
jgi:hypothetical protein